MFNKPIIKGIMAATLDGVIGINNTLPWHYEDELEHFKKTTLNHIIIMGSKTYLSTPKNIFTERTSIIFSKEHHFKTNYGKVVNSLDEFLQLIPTLDKSKTIFMIGGAEIAHLFLEANLISSFILTEIHHPYKGDTYLNLEYFNSWNKTIIISNEKYTILELYPA